MKTVNTNENQIHPKKRKKILLIRSWQIQRLLYFQHINKIKKIYTQLSFIRRTYVWLFLEKGQKGLGVDGQKNYKQKRRKVCEKSQFLFKTLLNRLSVLINYLNLIQLRGTRDDIEAEDDQESFFRWLEENPNAGVSQADDDDQQDLDYDADGNIIVPEKSKVWIPEHNTF